MSVLTFEFLDVRECSSCGKMTVSSKESVFRFCAGCMCRSYCDETCQKRDWALGHKYRCLCTRPDVTEAAVAAVFTARDLHAPSGGYKFSAIPPGTFSDKKHAVIENVLRSYQVPAYVIDEAELTGDTRSQAKQTPAGSTVVGIVLVRYPGTPHAGLQSALEYLSRDNYAAALGLGAESRRKLAELVIEGKISPTAGMSQIPARLLAQPGERGAPAVPSPAPPPRAAPVAEPRYYGRHRPTVDEQIRAQEMLRKISSGKGEDAQAAALSFAKVAQILSGSEPDPSPSARAVPRPRLSESDSKNVTERIRYAFSALDYSDVATAVQNCRTALEVLYGTSVTIKEL
jgi:hypothetical protein